jgi:hypothetical protein
MSNLLNLQLMQKKPLTGVLIVGVLLAGMFLLNRKPAEFEGVRALRVTQLSANLYEVSWESGFYNPNWLSTTFEDIDLQIWIDNNPEGEVKQHIGQGIPSRKSTYFPMNVRLTGDEYARLKVTNSTEFTFTGKALFSTFGSKKEIEINKTETLTTAASI